MFDTAAETLASDVFFRITCSGSQMGLKYDAYDERALLMFLRVISDRLNESIRM